VRFDGGAPEAPGKVVGARAHPRGGATWRRRR
jgi:hypothetical protein